MPELSDDGSPPTREVEATPHKHHTIVVLIRSQGIGQASQLWEKRKLDY